MRAASVNFKLMTWLEHEDGTTGLALRWGTWDWITNTAKPASKYMALHSPEPAVQVHVGNDEIWWPLSYIKGPAWNEP